MKKILIATTAVLALTLASTGFAATAKHPAADKGTCDSLIKQFDDAVPTPDKAAKINDAKKDRDAGEKLCAAGNFKKGSHDLRNALADLGVKPVMTQPAMAH